ncbi:MAG: CopG family ribbon-helix-helix protein [Burkholderiales bacterium]|nr:ribbon-helix-helix protein, CopG family [Burkholderiales bacterium]MDQ3194970.1 CopG family ribbon-helix-helix protein [Pseudomonadota bacterium]
MSEPITLRLDPDLKARLDNLCKATERSRAFLAAEAVRQYVELNEWQIAAIEEGIREADQGRLIDHATLKAKWEKRLAVALVKAR